MTLSPKKWLKRLVRRAYDLEADTAAEHLSVVEERLFSVYPCDDRRTNAVFVLASPRTGSTALYQLMAKYLRLPYLSNFTVRHFRQHPFVGAVVEAAMLGGISGAGIEVRNANGETFGDHAPSEASAVFDRWFYRRHPAETRSAQVIPGQDAHLRGTIGGIAGYFGRPVLTKNAWNCFRVRALSGLFPQARFVWLRRNIVRSAYSTLVARQRDGDPRTVWNSASPANYTEIRRLPPHEQVVEQQYWTNRAVETALRELPVQRSTEVWYEDLVEDPEAVLIRVADELGFPLDRGSLRGVSADLVEPAGFKDHEDFERIREYCLTRYPACVRRG